MVFLFSIVVKCLIILLKVDQNLDQNEQIDIMPLTGKSPVHVQPTKQYVCNIQR